MVVLAFDLKNCWKYRLIVSYTMNCMDGLEARIMDAAVPFQRAERPSCDAILHKPSKIIHGQISTSCCMYMYKDNEPKCNKKSKWISHHFSFHKLYASQTAKKKWLSSFSDSSLQSLPMTVKCKSISHSLLRYCLIVKFLVFRRRVTYPNDFPWIR